LHGASADPDGPLGVQHQDGPEWVKEVCKAGPCTSPLTPQIWSFGLLPRRAKTRPSEHAIAEIQSEAPLTDERIVWSGQPGPLFHAMRYDTAKSYAVVTIIEVNG
jgi:hypothetical protein